MEDTLKGKNLNQQPSGLYLTPQLTCIGSATTNTDLILLEDRIESAQAAWVSCGGSVVKASCYG